MLFVIHSQSHVRRRGKREELRVQRVAAPHELEQMLERNKQRNLVVMAAGQPPVILQRVLNYEAAHFAGIVGR